MRRIGQLLLVACTLLMPGFADAASVTPQIPFSVKTTLTAGQTYKFRFSLFADGSAGREVWREYSSYKVPANQTISHALGRVNAFSEGMHGVDPSAIAKPVDFSQQLWVEVQGGRFSKRVKLGVVPYAMWSATSPTNVKCGRGYSVTGFDGTGKIICTLNSYNPGIDLSDAVLISDDLSRYDLSGANLSGANLAGADLSKARLEGATLTAAILTAVTWSNTICPDGTNSATNGTSPESCVGHGVEPGQAAPLTELMDRWNLAANDFSFYWDMAGKEVFFHWLVFDSFPHPTFYGGSQEAYSTFANVLVAFLENTDNFDFLAANGLFTLRLRTHGGSGYIDTTFKGWVESLSTWSIIPVATREKLLALSEQIQAILH
jgi:hypothetical protein